MSEVITGPGAFGVDMNQLIHGDTVTFEGAEHLTYSGLFATYAESHYGLSHAEQELRYAHTYKWEREQMLKDLGDDVHPTIHMPHTESAILRPLIARQNAFKGELDEQLTPEDITVARVAATFHDIGECKHSSLIEICGGVVGDVNFWDKTKKHEKKEAAIRAHIFETVLSGIPSDLRAKAEHVIAKPEANFAGETFAVAEQVGYFLAGVSAAITAVEAEHTIQSDADELRFVESKRMAVEVGLRWRKPELLGIHLERFPYVRQVVAEHQMLLDYVEENFAA